MNTICRLHRQYRDEENVPTTTPLKMPSLSKPAKLCNEIRKLTMKGDSYPKSADARSQTEANIERKHSPGGSIKYLDDLGKNLNLAVLRFLADLTGQTTPYFETADGLKDRLDKKLQYVKVDPKLLLTGTKLYRLDSNGSIDIDDTADDSNQTNLETSNVPHYAFGGDTGGVENTNEGGSKQKEGNHHYGHGRRHKQQITSTPSDCLSGSGGGGEDGDGGDDKKKRPPDDAMSKDDPDDEDKERTRKKILERIAHNHRWLDRYLSSHQSQPFLLVQRLQSLLDDIQLFLGLSNQTGWKLLFSRVGLTKSNMPLVDQGMNNPAAVSGKYRRQMYDLQTTLDPNPFYILDDFLQSMSDDRHTHTFLRSVTSTELFQTLVASITQMFIDIEFHQLGLDVTSLLRYRTSSPLTHEDQIMETQQLTMVKDEHSLIKRSLPADIPVNRHDKENMEMNVYQEIFEPESESHLRSLRGFVEYVASFFSPNQRQLRPLTPPLCGFQLAALLLSLLDEFNLVVTINPERLLGVYSVTEGQIMPDGRFQSEISRLPSIPIPTTFRDLAICRQDQEFHTPSGSLCLWPSHSPQTSGVSLRHEQALVHVQTLPLNNTTSAATQGMSILIPLQQMIMELWRSLTANWLQTSNVTEVSICPDIVELGYIRREGTLQNGSMTPGFGLTSESPADMVLCLLQAAIHDVSHTTSQRQIYPLTLTFLPAIMPGVEESFMPAMRFQRTASWSLTAFYQRSFGNLDVCLRILLLRRGTYILLMAVRGSTILSEREQRQGPLLVRVDGIFLSVLLALLRTPWAPCVCTATWTACILIRQQTTHAHVSLVQTVVRANPQFSGTTVISLAVVQETPGVQGVRRNAYFTVRSQADQLANCLGNNSVHQRQLMPGKTTRTEHGSTTPDIRAYQQHSSAGSYTTTAGECQPNFQQTWYPAEVSGLQAGNTADEAEAGPGVQERTFCDVPRFGSRPSRTPRSGRIRTKQPRTRGSGRTQRVQSRALPPGTTKTVTPHTPEPVRLQKRQLNTPERGRMQGAQPCSVGSSSGRRQPPFKDRFGKTMARTLPTFCFFDGAVSQKRKANHSEIRHSATSPQVFESSLPPSEGQQSRPSGASGDSGGNSGGRRPLQNPVSRVHGCPGPPHERGNADERLSSEGQHSRPSGASGDAGGNSVRRRLSQNPVSRVHGCPGPPHERDNAEERSSSEGQQSRPSGASGDSGGNSVRRRPSQDPVSRVHGCPGPPHERGNADERLSSEGQHSRPSGASGDSGGNSVRRRPSQNPVLLMHGRPGPPHNRDNVEECSLFESGQQSRPSGASSSTRRNTVGRGPSSQNPDAHGRPAFDSRDTNASGDLQDICQAQHRPSREGARRCLIQRQCFEDLQAVPDKASDYDVHPPRGNDPEVPNGHGVRHPSQCHEDLQRVRENPPTVSNNDRAPDQASGGPSRHHGLTPAHLIPRSQIDLRVTLVELEELERRVLQLLEENRRMRRSFLCQLCWQRDFTCVFEPCGHKACDECAIVMDYCYGCGRPILAKHPASFG